MAESVVYEDTPFAEYLADIGTQEEFVKQPDPAKFEDENKEKKLSVMSSNLLHVLIQAVRNVKEALSTAVPQKDENQFEERFRYILCTSHLLNETLSIHFYGSKRSASIRVGERSPYIPGVSQRNFEIFLSVVLGVTIVIFTMYFVDESNDAILSLIKMPSTILVAIVASFWLYRRMVRQYFTAVVVEDGELDVNWSNSQRRKAIKALHDSALYYLEKLVCNSQAFDLKVNKALMIVQEIELVSRGYRLSTPLSPITRIEQSSKSRRCTVLRDTLCKLLHEAYIGYCNTIDATQPETSAQSLAMMYNMYNIVPSTSDDDWKKVDGEDCPSLEHLKRCFQMLHAKRRECLCHFLALDIMTAGRDAHRRDYERHWGIVNAILSGLGTMTGHYLDNVVLATAAEPFAAQPSKQVRLSENSPLVGKQLRAYFHRLASIGQHIRAVQAKLHICDDDAQKYFVNEKADAALGQRGKESLIKQYNSISHDITYMLQEWEQGKQALLALVDPTNVDTSANDGPSLEMDSQDSEKSDTDNERASQRTLIDWTEIDEPLNVPAQYFEGDAEPEVKKKLTREERIALQKAKREQELQAKATRFNAECMVHELKDVLVQRKPTSIEDTPNGNLRKRAVPISLSPIKPAPFDAGRLSRTSGHQQLYTPMVSSPQTSPILTTSVVSSPQTSPILTTPVVSSPQISPKVTTPVFVSSNYKDVKINGSGDLVDTEHQGLKAEKSLESPAGPTPSSVVGS